MGEFLCPSCGNGMTNYKENHYRCVCGARAVQLTLYEDTIEGGPHEPAKGDEKESE